VVIQVQEIHSSVTRELLMLTMSEIVIHVILLLVEIMVVRDVIVVVHVVVDMVLDYHMITVIHAQDIA
jgi:hypothetical protein